MLGAENQRECRDARGIRAFGPGCPPAGGKRFADSAASTRFSPMPAIAASAMPRIANR